MINTPQIVTIAIDDDPDMLVQIRSILQGIAEYHGFETEDEFRASGILPDIAILDHRLQSGRDGIQVLDMIRELSRENGKVIGCLFIIISGQHNGKIFSEYSRRGIFDYIEKRPGFEFEKHLLEAVQKAIEKVNYYRQVYEDTMNDIREIQNARIKETRKENTI